MNKGWRVGYQREGSSYCYLAPLPSLSISSPQLSVSQSPDSIHQKLPQPLSRTLPGMSNNCPRFSESFQHWTFGFRFACFCRYFVSSVKSVCRSSWPVKIVLNAQSLLLGNCFQSKTSTKGLQSSNYLPCVVTVVCCVYRKVRVMSVSGMQHWLPPIYWFICNLGNDSAALCCSEL